MEQLLRRICSLEPLPGYLKLVIFLAASGGRMKILKRYSRREGYCFNKNDIWMMRYHGYVELVDDYVVLTGKGREYLARLREVLRDAFKALQDS